MRESRSLADPWSFPIDAHEFRRERLRLTGDAAELARASVHNVIVETTDETVKAYLSWYWDGMLVLDVTDPYNPKETARYFDNSPEFLASNGGQPHDFWGVGKEPEQPWIYGSDRNGGLYVFKEQRHAGSELAGELSTFHFRPDESVDSTSASSVE